MLKSRVIVVSYSSIVKKKGEKKRVCAYFFSFRNKIASTDRHNTFLENYCYVS